MYSKHKYGSGSHSSLNRKIIGSVVLPLRSELGFPVKITHIVLEGSSQWVIGRKIIEHCKIDHFETNYLSFESGDSVDSITFIEHEFLSYISIDSYFPDNYTKTFSVMNSSAIMGRIWKEVKKSIEKVQKHVCGHATLNDFKL